MSLNLCNNFASFKPAWWLPGPHLQTLAPLLYRRGLRVPLQRERVELPDDDFLDLDWTLGRQEGPLVLILHGLGGSSRSHYVVGLLTALHRVGVRAVVMHLRGCSGEPNRLTHSYHAGATGDLGWVVDYLQTTCPATPLAAIGYSLGGNLLLKWLGERPERRLHTAVAVSVPFELHHAASRLNSGLSQIYQRVLLRCLKHSMRTKCQDPTYKLPFHIEELARIKDFYQFDDRVTAPLHGFANAAEYYERTSCRRYLKRIQTPTLILHAQDDPFTRPEAIPLHDELSSQVSLEVCEHGGHVGFITGCRPWQPRFWLEERILAHLRESGMYFHSPGAELLV